MVDEIQVQPAAVFEFEKKLQDQRPDKPRRPGLRILIDYVVKPAEEVNDDVFRADSKQAYDEYGNPSLSEYSKTHCEQLPSLLLSPSFPVP